MGKIKKTKQDKLSTKLRTIKAKDIMTREVITTTEDAHLADIAELMIKKGISGLPVLDEKEKLIGTITVQDLFLVMDMIKSGDIVGKDEFTVSEPTVKFAMSAGTPKVDKNTTLEEIIVIMKYRNAHTLPVFDGGKMVGVVGRRDIFKKFYSTIKEIY